MPRDHEMIGTEDVLRAFFNVPGGETRAMSFMLKGGFAREVLWGMYEYSDNVSSFKLLVDRCPSAAISEQSWARNCPTLHRAKTHGHMTPFAGSAGPGERAEGSYPPRYGFRWFGSQGE